MSTHEFRAGMTLPGDPTDRPRLSVIGTGYLGATHAVCMAELGYEVMGVDVDPSKVDLLNSGRTPFFEPGLPELLVKALDSGRLTFTTSIEEAAAFGDVHFICVGTPQIKGGGGAADMTYVDAAFEALGASLRPGSVVVGKSTVPAGTAARLAARLAQVAPHADLAWNPEFLREGFAVEDTMTPDRLVFGIQSEHGERMLRAAYAPVIDAGTPVVITDFATAELVKVAANSFLATKISFINAMAEVCEAVGGDVTLLSKALSYDTRIGGRFLHAGLGFGGGCLPKDIRAFVARTEELGIEESVAFLREVDQINLRRRTKVLSLARELLGGQLAGKAVTVLGAAFKPNSDDVRDSPSLDIAARLATAGAVVTVHDPQAIENARRSYPQLQYAETALDALTGASLIILATEWDQYCSLVPSMVREHTAGTSIIDARNVLDAEAWRADGWTFRALGRP